MKITVTGADIAQGCRLSATECPFALALARAAGLYPVVRRTVATVYSGEADAILATLRPRHPAVKRWRLPRRVTTWIDAFDRGVRVEPFEVDL